MKREYANALFGMAGFDVKSIHELPNGYWPSAYTEMREQYPWWLIETQFGLVKIGWRKRVIQITWTDATYRGSVTADDTTKDDDLVHAWSYAKALEYLVALFRNMRQADYAAKATSQPSLDEVTGGGKGKRNGNF